MAGSKSKSGVKTRGGGHQRRGGGGGRSSDGTSTGGLEALATVATQKASATGGSQIRSSRDNRAQVDGASRRDKGKGIDGRGSSSQIDGGELSPPGRMGHNSSHDSTRSTRRSPTSQETPQSAGNGSVSRSLPLQYPASSNRVSRSLPLQYPDSSNRVQHQPTFRRPNLNLNLQHQQHLQVQTQVQEEEEDEEEEEENVDGEEDLDINPDDIEPEDEGDEGNGEDEDYEQLLADILADPERQRLPLLSEEPVPDSIW